MSPEKPDKIFSLNLFHSDKLNTAVIQVCVFAQSVGRNFRVAWYTEDAYIHEITFQGFPGTVLFQLWKNTNTKNQE